MVVASGSQIYYHSVWGLGKHYVGVTYLYSRALRQDHYTKHLVPLPSFNPYSVPLVPVL